MKTLVIAFYLTLVVTAHAGSAVEAWVQRYSNIIDSYDEAAKVVTDSAGNVIVAGRTANGVTGSDILVIKYANDGPPMWTNRYDGPVHGYDAAAALGVDGSGNVIVAGSSEFDFVTIKYSSAGAPLWTNRLNGAATALVMDGSGNVLVTGISYDADPNGEYATVMYSSLGVPLWTNRYNGPGNGYDFPRAVAVDASGNVFVTGQSYSGSSDDYATVAYSSLGVPLWTNRYNGVGNGDDVAQAVAVTGTNVFVTGSAYGGSTLNDCATIGYSTSGATLWTQLYNGPGNDYDEAVALAVVGTNAFVTGWSRDALTSNDYLILMYSRTGTLLVSNRYDGPANSDDRATAITVDAANRVIVTGSSPGIGTGGDCATISFSSLGVPLWTNRYDGGGGPNYSDGAVAVAADNSGNVFVTALSQSTASTDWLTIKYSSSGGELWINRYNGLARSDGYPQAVAVDSGGNVIVTGYSTGNGTSDDYATIKYSSMGVPLWTNRYNGPGTIETGDRASAVAVDGSGNVFVTGSSWSDSLDYFTIAYSSAGATSWSRRYNGPGNSGDRATALAVDSGGKVIVTGSASDFFGARDYATLAYSNGGTPLWTNLYSGPGILDDIAVAVATDSGNNVIVTGYSDGGGSSGNDYATIKYSSTGLPLWTNRYSGPGNNDDEAWAVTVDHSGNVIVTGTSYSGATSYDYLTIKYSSTGVALWTNCYNGTVDGYDWAWAVAVDSGDNVIVTGESDGGAGGFDFVTIKYSSAGAGLWTNRFNGPANDFDGAYAVAVDGNDTVFVTGYSASGSVLDFATVAYSSAGVPQWTNRYSGPDNGSDYPLTSRSLAVAGNGSVVVVGQSYLGQHNEYAAVKYVTVPRLDVRRTATNTVAVTWPSPSSGFQLQQNTNLVGPNWISTAASSDDGTNKTFIVNPPTGSSFYRLLYQ